MNKRSKIRLLHSHCPSPSPNKEGRKKRCSKRKWVFVPKGQIACLVSKAINNDNQGGGWWWWHRSWYRGMGYRDACHRWSWHGHGQVIIMHTFIDVDDASINTPNNIHLSIHPSIYLPPFSSYIYSVHRLITRLHINIVRPNSHYINIKIDRRISITTTA